MANIILFFFKKWIDVLTAIFFLFIYFVWLFLTLNRIDRSNRETSTKAQSTGKQKKVGFLTL